MSEAIIAAIITGIFSLVGVIIANRESWRKIEQKLEISQAVTDERIKELTREVRKHNNFAERMPIVETEIKHITEEVHTLESYHMPKNQ